MASFAPVFRGLGDGSLRDSRGGSVQSEGDGVPSVSSGGRDGIESCSDKNPTTPTTAKATAIPRMIPAADKTISREVNLQPAPPVDPRDLPGEWPFRVPDLRGAWLTARSKVLAVLMRCSSRRDSFPSSWRVRGDSLIASCITSCNRVCQLWLSGRTDRCGV